MLLKGAPKAKDIYRCVSAQISRLAESGVTPQIAFLVVGSRSDSASYVNIKAKRCEKLNILQQKLVFEESVSSSQLISAIEGLNKDPAVHAILVQMPLPPHLDPKVIIDTIDPRKDVDGLHSLNMGKLSMLKYERSEDVDIEDPLRSLAMTGFPLPCTAFGVLYLLRAYDIDVFGKHVVIIGRSSIAGKPLSLLLLAHNATVTVCHSNTPPEVMRALSKSSDVLIVAAGVPGLVREDWVTSKSVVVDVGITSVPSDNERGYRLAGDVDFDRVSSVAASISPVPGGVGPMTIAALMLNIVMCSTRVYK